MVDKQIKGMTAAKLRIILFAAIFLLLALGGGAFWLLRNQLAQFANDVQVAKEKASVSDADIAQLQRIQKTLEEDQVAITRAKSIVADSQSYQYQDQIVNDITAYAKKAGVAVTGFTFNSDSDVTGSSSDNSTVPSAGTAAAPGLKTTSVSVSIKNPVDYKKVMRFIHLIELNLTKMQLTGISLTKASGEKADTSQVIANPLTIEVYTK